MKVRFPLVTRYARPARTVFCFAEVRRAGAAFGRMSWRSWRRAQSRARLERYDVLDLDPAGPLVGVVVGSYSHGVWYPRSSLTKH